MNNGKKKIIVILGPTASGKTRLAVKLANLFNGEIVSADSRQVYKGMDIGTGKDLEEFSIFNFQFSKKIQIPHHLIDVVSPKKQFDLASYQKLAFAAIDDILSRGKLPILTGGSGLYLQAVVENFKLSDAKKNSAARAAAEELSADELFSKLEKLAPKMALRLNQSDKNNKRRLVRYLEILEQNESLKRENGRRKYDAMIIGLDCPRSVLKQRIAKRITDRLEGQKMVEEVEKLKVDGLSWKRLESFGLEYKFISLYLQKKLTYEDMTEKLTIATNQFSKRQATWFKRWEKQGAKINWLSDEAEIEKLVKKFIE